MLAEAFAWIHNRAVKPIERIMEIHGEKHFVHDGGVSAIEKPDHVPSLIGTETLSGLLTLIKSEGTRFLDDAEFQFIIRSPNRVDLVTVPRGPKNDRLAMAIAKVDYEAPRTERMSVETMIVTLATKFEKTADRGRIMALVSNVTNTESVQQSDDGISQHVVLKKGIDNASKEKVEPVVVLRPYRTFPEIAQPDARYLFRLYGDNKTGVTASLTMIEDASWKLSVKADIERWIRENWKRLVGDGEAPAIIW